MPIVRKHLTGGFLCAVLDLSWILCSLLIPEYSGIKRSDKPLPGLRNACISFLSYIRWSVTIYNPLPFYEPYGKSDYLQPSLFGHLMRRVDSLEKTDAGRDWRQEEKGMTEDEMAGWHHWLDGRESEWTPGVGDGQGGLVCCDSWERKESDTTEQLNWTELFDMDCLMFPW